MSPSRTALLLIGLSLIPAGAASASPPVTWESLRHIPRDCPVVHDNDGFEDTNDDESLLARAHDGQADLALERLAVALSTPRDPGDLRSVPGRGQETRAQRARAQASGRPSVGPGAGSGDPRPARRGPGRGRETRAQRGACATQLIRALTIALGSSVTSRSRAETAYPVRVSEDGHFLIDQHGQPFFYLGDTAWELFHRLDRGEAEVYLKDRAAKQFTVIQAVVLAEHGGLDVPNAYGHLPLVARDPTRPVEAYFQHVDFVVDRAEELGLVIGMLPTWGSWWHDGRGIFTPETAESFGEHVGRRYRYKPIIWILGGDRPIENDRQRAIIRAMARGLRRGDGGRHLITFHPPGGRGSSRWFQGEDWLAFNMIQSGHGYNHANYEKIAADYVREPTKPCIDGEPGYEDHPAEFNAKNGYLNEYDVRKFAYWSLFAGACGHTYGCHDIWQFLAPGRSPITVARTPWRTAKDLPGASQMQYARALVESRPVLTRIPDQSLLASDPGRGTDHIQATRAVDGSYAFVYSASGRPFTVDLEKLSGQRLRASWYDPRSGVSRSIGSFPRAGRKEFRPPSQGNGHDWVLVIDDEARGYPEPGKAGR